MSRILDLTGKRFGKLVVVEYAGLNDKGKAFGSANVIAVRSI